MTVPVQPFASTARRIAAYGVATALMLITPGLMVFAPASIFHCAMRNGRRVAWGAGLFAIVLAGVCVLASVSAVTDVETANMAYAVFLGAALALALPSIIAAPLVERHATFGNVLTFALVFSAIGLGLTEFVMHSAVGYSPYAAQVREQSAIIAQNLGNYRAAIAEGTFGRILVWLLDRAPQIFFASLLTQLSLFLILSLMMVGRLSVWRAFANAKATGEAVEVRRTYLFRNFSLPEWLLFVFVVGGLTPLLSGFAQHVTANALALMVSLYMLQGLAIFRFMLVKAGAGLVGTVVGFFLLAMLCMTTVGILMLTLAGLFDPFFDFRHLKRKDDSHESHTD